MQDAFPFSSIILRAALLIASLPFELPDVKAFAVEYRGRCALAALPSKIIVPHEDTNVLTRPRAAKPNVLT